MPEWIQVSFYGNPLLAWAIAAGAAVLLFLVLLTLRRVLPGRVDGPEGSIRATFALQVRRTNRVFLLLASVYGGAYALALPGTWRSLLATATVIALILQVAVWASALINVWLAGYLARRTAADGTTSGALSILRLVGRIVVWSVAALLVLDNLGINITALVAGLGIGGIAIGLAAQQILGDLFASLAIMLDKPFETGDFLIFGDYLGTVERIGIKTTRIRSLSGEQIVCANSDLLGSRIRNYKRMAERRVVFTVGVVYQTPAEKLEAISAMLREIVQAQPNTRFDRAHFAKFGDSSLVYEVVYYVLSADYNVYMDIQQAINLGIAQRFAAEGIVFAYPTQTLYVSKQE